MKIAVGLLTYNVVSTGRYGLLRQTAESLRKNAGFPIEIVAVNNHSTDNTHEILEQFGFDAIYHSQDHNHTSAHGNNLAAVRAMALFRPDIVVLSDDDVEWQPNWARKLEAFWEDAPEHVKLAGGHLEPEYAWSEVLGVVEYGHQKGLVRTSTGAATWSFRARDWPYIGPLPTQRQGWGDLPACERIRKQGFLIVQLDLAVHLGENQSSWGNTTNRLKVKPLDREKWNL